jgi:adenylyl- and sulfurtransferase ThiI
VRPPTLTTRPRSTRSQYSGNLEKNIPETLKKLHQDTINQSSGQKITIFGSQKGVFKQQKAQSLSRLMFCGKNHTFANFLCLL